jgi:inositol-1,3,4-trisphosphate 5/6-kinase / inositol-tetrakisphosphate 1-kinase
MSQGLLSMADSNCNNYDDHDSLATATTMTESERPILVGYAFGPKKMSTMGVVMAEASKTKVAYDDRVMPSTTTTTSTTTTAGATTTTTTTKNRSESVVFSISGGPSAGLRNIVRYFRSNCSSCGDEDDTGTMTSASSSCHPIRVSFVPLDLDAPLEDQHGGNFDVILHKMTEDCLVLSQMDQHVNRLVRDATDKEWNAAMAALPLPLHRIHRLIRYQEQNKTCALVDHPSNVQVVMSRLDICTILSQCLVGVTSTTGLPCKTPKFVAVHTDAHALNYPLIAKPITAAGTKKSHCLGIVLNHAGLQHVEPDCLLQEYANHESVLHKVYVLGETVHVFSRPSLPNLPTRPQELQRLDPYVEFDSQRPYPSLADFGLGASHCPNADDVGRSSPSPATVPVEELTPIVAALRRAFGLDLFGFDILHTGDVLLVVDVNYFPSYKEVTNFPHLLAQYLTSMAIQNRANAMQDGVCGPPVLAAGERNSSEPQNRDVLVHT